MNLGMTPGQRLASEITRNNDVDKPIDLSDIPFGDEPVKRKIRINLFRRNTPVAHEVVENIADEVLPSDIVPPSIIQDIRPQRVDTSEIQHGRRNLAINVSSQITNHILNGSCWSCGVKDVPFSQQIKNNGLCDKHA